MSAAYTTLAQILDTHILGIKKQKDTNRRQTKLSVCNERQQTKHLKQGNQNDRQKRKAIYKFSYKTLVQKNKKKKIGCWIKHLRCIYKIFLHDKARWITIDSIISRRNSKVAKEKSAFEPIIRFFFIHFHSVFIADHLIDFLEAGGV